MAFGGRGRFGFLCGLTAAMTAAVLLITPLAVGETGTASFRAVAGTPVTTPVLPEVVAFRPTGGLLAVADAGPYPLDNSRGTATAITMFGIGHGGRLTRLPSSVLKLGFGKGSYPLGIEFSPNGKLLAGRRA